jgi:tRNA dimethylallyltransferase
MRRVIIIVGPTAVGKTAVSLELAAKLGAEVISADSRQIYKFMDIGTAKPTFEERRRILHHFIDLFPPDVSYSAGAFGKEARQLINTLFEAGKLPIVVGGAGFYIRALVDGLQTPEIQDAQIKLELMQRLQDSGLTALFEELQEKDPTAARQIHSNDTQRILRALEVIHITGQPFSGFLNQKLSPAEFEPLFIGFTRERQQLYKIIEKRVDLMIQQGLIEEVRQLWKQGYGPELNALQTVGYKEVFNYLQNQISHTGMIDLIKRNSRRYAKRQLTWFNADRRIFWINLDENAKIELLVDYIVQKFDIYQ